MARETDKRSDRGEQSANAGAGGVGRPPADDALRRVAAQADSGPGFLGSLREWLDALIIAFVLAMFIRTFVVELFKIPSGSMSPTLLGDWVAEGQALDESGQARQFLLIANRPQTVTDMERMPVQVQVYQKDASGNYRYQGKRFGSSLTPSQQMLLDEKGHREEHRIFVNKMAYWFKPPDRGDIVVFKVPLKKEPSVYIRADGVNVPVRHTYNRNTSVYVKRAVAFGGEEVMIRDGDERLYINGQPLTEPPIFQQRQYFPPQYNGFGPREKVYYDKVPEGQVLMLGDNSDNSLDSRYWGSVPQENLRGKAFLRYWPWRKFKFLE